MNGKRQNGERDKIQDDGLLEVFILDKQNLKTVAAAAGRMLNLRTEVARQFFWRGKDITIETEPDQPVWTDGEYFGRTPVSLSSCRESLRWL